MRWERDLSSLFLGFFGEWGLIGDKGGHEAWIVA